MSSCIGDFSYEISDLMNFGSDDIKSVEHVEENSNGRKNVKVSLKDNKSENFYLTLFAKDSGNKECYKDMNGAYVCEDLTVVMFNYYTTNAEKYKNSFSLGKGSIIIDEINSDSVNIEWNKNLEKTDKDITLANAIYKVYVSDELHDFEHMESVCYLSRLNKNETLVETKDLADKIHATISNLKTDNKYYINVLAKNLDTNDVIAFQPVEIITRGRSLPTPIIVMIVVAILVLIFLVWYFYRKYKFTNEVLKYEVNDVRNLSNLPKSEAEMRTMVKEIGERKYQNLNDEANMSNV